MEIKKFLEFVQNDFEPIKSFYLKDGLDDRIWNDFELDDAIRRKLVEIGQEAYEETEYKAEIQDIVLCGSLCNYNWDAKYSDFDLHVIIKHSDINPDKETAGILCDYAKRAWNSRHDIKIDGYDVELMIQDVDDLQMAIDTNRMGGVYSLLNSEWIKKPVRKEFTPDEDAIRSKAENVMTQLDEVEEMVRDENPDYKSILIKLKKAWDKIKKFRQEGMESSEPELSLGNLVFKLLRRNGYIEKVVDLKIEAYDKQFK